MRRREGGKEGNILLRECSRGTEHTYLQWVGTDRQTDGQANRPGSALFSVLFISGQPIDTIRYVWRREKRTGEGKRRRIRDTHSYSWFVRSKVVGELANGLS